MPVSESTKPLSSPGRARYLCLWIPHFEAWCALQTMPQLRGLPFAVHRDGRVLAASPLARTGGVEAGQTAGRAQARCTSLHLLPQDVARETLAWDEIQRLVYGLTPCLESTARGLLFADIGKAPLDSFSTLARSCGAVAGIASDRATAHLAALTGPPGKLRRVETGREMDFVRHLPVEPLRDLGVPDSVLQSLHWFGWKQIGDLRRLTRRQLEEQYNASGTTLWRYSRASECRDNLRPVATWTPPPEVLHRIAFELPCREPGEWEPALDELLRRACADLDHQWAQALEINVETPAGTLAARRVLKEPVNRPDSLHRPARSALAEALGIVPLQPVVVALEVRLGALTGADTQRNLFEGLEKSTDARHSDRRKRLGRVIERMETRCPGTLGQYAAGNSHSPFREDAFRWLPALRELHRLRAAP